MKTKRTEKMIDSPMLTKEDLEQETAGVKDPSESCCSRAPENGSVEEYRKTEKDVAVSFTLEGMSCASCAHKIEKALCDLPSVKAAKVNFLRQEAIVIMNKDEAFLDDLRTAVEAEGYRLLDKTNQDTDEKKKGSDHPTALKPYLIGAATCLGVIGFYLGLLTLTSDWYSARLEFREYGIWIIALALGLGVQVTLFSLYRSWRRGEPIKAAKYSLAASGGMSTTAMAACCSHYLAVFLPALGLPFLSAAAASLANYQVYFFMAGVISNLFGIGVMLRMMYRSGMIQMRFPMIQSPLYFKR